MKMDEHWLRKLLSVLQIQTNSENEKLMVLYLDKELRKLKLPYTIDAAGNILVIKGEADTYPCVTSHMDTVHNFEYPFTIYHDINDNDILFAMSNKLQVGIGGDDKCGVFACLYLLATLPKLKVVFFSREEVGCMGSSKIDFRFFKDCRYLIQLDRRGKSDLIQTYSTNKTISHDFSSEIGLVKKAYGFKNAIGSVTDVMHLWDNRVGISCVNISSGYYNPHSHTEYISIKDLENSISFTQSLIDILKHKRYVCYPPKQKKQTYNNYNYIGYEQCHACKAWKIKSILYKVKGKYYCFSCRPDTNKNKIKDAKAKNYKCPRCSRKLTENDIIEKYNHEINKFDLVCNTCKTPVILLKNKKKADIIKSNKKVLSKDSVYLCEQCGKELAPGKLWQCLNEKVYCNECAESFKKS